jgi:hypothetical protein
MNHATMDLSPRHPRGTERELAVGRLNGFAYVGRRLARIRRILGAFLIIFGTPVVVLIRSTDPAVRHTLVGLALAWLALFVPMGGLLCVEWRNSRRADDLRAGIDRRAP